jgi:hypothetical protein
LLSISLPQSLHSMSMSQLVVLGPQPGPGRVADLVAKHQTNLEKVFLDIVGYQLSPAS